MGAAGPFVLCSPSMSYETIRYEVDERDSGNGRRVLAVRLRRDPRS